MDAKKFGAFIAEMRKEKNMTQADLAIKLQVTNKAVSRWERGIGFPDINTLEPLAGALGISVQELMKSEKEYGESISKTEVAEVLNETLNIARYQRKQEQKIIPIIIYAGSCIVACIGSTNHDNLLTIVASFVALASAIVMGIYTWKMPVEYRKKLAIVELMYCLSVYLCFGIFSWFIGNVLSSVIIVGITCLYAKWVSRKSIVVPSDKN